MLNINVLFDSFGYQIGINYSNWLRIRIKREKKIGLLFDCKLNDTQELNESILLTQWANHCHLPSPQLQSMSMSNGNAGHQLATHR